MDARTLLILFATIFSFLNVSISQVSHRVIISPNDISFNKEKGDDGIEYDRINLNKGTHLSEVGKPELPTKLINLLIPVDQDVDNIITTNFSTTEKTGKYNIYPTQPDYPTSIDIEKPKFLKPDKNVYESDDCYPKNAATIVHQGYFDGDKHIVTVSICPVQYYPKSGRLIINNSIEIGLQFKSGKMKIIHHGVRTYETQKMYDQVLSSIVENPEMIYSYSSSSIQDHTYLSKATVTETIPHYKYVIITTSALQSSFDKFIAWKKRKGIDIGVVTTDWIFANYTGDLIYPQHAIYDNPGKVRQYLYDAYMQGTMWVLMGGDYNTSVSIRYGCGARNYWSSNPGCQYQDDYKIPTDLYFADFNGDWNADGDQYTGEEFDDSPDYDP